MITRRPDANDQVELHNGEISVWVAGERLSLGSAEHAALQQRGPLQCFCHHQRNVDKWAWREILVKVKLSKECSVHVDLSMIAKSRHTRIRIEQLHIFCLTYANDFQWFSASRWPSCSLCVMKITSAFLHVCYVDDRLSKMTSALPKVLELLDTKTCRASRWRS